MTPTSEIRHDAGDRRSEIRRIPLRLLGRDPVPQLGEVDEFDLHPRPFREALELIPERGKLLLRVRPTAS